MTGDVLLVIAATAGLLLLGRLELRRPDRRRLAGRLAATAIATGALLALALEPERMVTRSGGTIVLATDGATDALLRSIADSAGNARVLRLGDSLPDAGALRRRFPAADRVVVAGWGLDDGDLARLAGVRLEHRAAPLPGGIVQLDYPARVHLGETVTIAGSAREVAGWVRLDGGAGPADSARPDSAGAFTVRHRPRAAGVARYVLRIDGGVAETLGVDVTARRAPAVVVLEAMPGFETSRLRDWLARRGSAVMIRTTISRGRTRVEQVNRSGATGTLTPAMLAEFDLVIADGRSLAALGAAERKALEGAIREGRLGLLLRVDEAVVTRSGVGFARFGLGAAGDGAERATRIGWSGLGGSSRSEVTAEPYVLREGFAIRTIARDGGGRPVAQWQPVGLGRVGVSLVRAPSRWLLAGEPEAYDGYWSLIVSSLARPRPEWVIEQATPAFVDRPLVIARDGEEAGHAVIVQPDGTRDTAYLAPAIDSTRWEGTWRPRHAGRHLIVGRDTAAFDVRGSVEWPALRAARRSAATTRAAVEARGQADSTRARTVTEAVPISPFPFFLAFVAAAGWLWWERRAPSTRLRRGDES